MLCDLATKKAWREIVPEPLWRPSADRIADAKLKTTLADNVAPMVPTSAPQTSGDGAAGAGGRAPAPGVPTAVGGWPELEDAAGAGWMEDTSTPPGGGRAQVIAAVDVNTPVRPSRPRRRLSGRYDRGLLFGVSRSGVGPGGTLLPWP